ncbi:WAS/WASL-interacting protein family member 2-like [Harpegnathos saltator]|uniref:WAS/WASL-interacting protein family member 2-like n=1 Tax=Harpegnathos saltator TaxID=610380 RepID=UPI000DBEEE33|nr:WAS/WASL-interacting protein family member 2-like [Harpegnathos saltator]XP_025159941.1 WAS/WASL-interacting protein family member 2-like [Harpegnathos saltator]XP_025162618.1 WAS/WASL-interacting protein family member 2-like [Harpegnathos saltator]
MELDNYIDELAELLLKTDDDAAAVWRRVTETAEKGSPPDRGGTSAEHHPEDPNGPPPALPAPAAAPPTVIRVSTTEPPPLAPITAKPGPSLQREVKEPTTRKRESWQKPAPPTLGRRIGRPRKGPQIRPAPPGLVDVARRREIEAPHGGPPSVVVSTTTTRRTIPVITLDEQEEGSSTAPAPPPRDMPLLGEDEPPTPMSNIQPGPVIRSNVPFRGTMRLLRDTPPPQARVQPSIQPPVQGPALPPPVPILLPTGEIWHVPYFSVRVSRKYRLRTLTGRWSLRFTRNGQLRTANRIPG